MSGWRVPGARAARAAIAGALCGVASPCAAQGAPTIAPAPAPRVRTEARAPDALVLHASGSLGTAPSRVFGSIVGRAMPALVLEWRRSLAGGARRGLAWAPALHPLLGMTAVPTRDALLFYDCPNLLAPGGGPQAPCPAQWSERRAAWGVAIEPVAVRVHQRVGRATLSLRPGIGAASFARAVPIPEGRRVNVLLRLDAALEWPVATRTSALAQFGYWHLSNAGTAPLNPGVDALQLSLGVTRALGRR